MMTCKRHVVILTGTLFAFIGVWLIYLAIRSGRIDNDFLLYKSPDQPYSNWIKYYRQCLAKRVKSYGWRNMSVVIDYCLGQAMFNMLDVRFLRNTNDVKLFIPPTKEKSFYSIVTLGIGNDIDAERQLQSKICHSGVYCKFIGADPIEESGVIYKEIGDYHQVAVGGRAGVVEATVLENGKYVPKHVTMITFVEFIKLYVQNYLIDVLFVDIEGGEQGLLPHLRHKKEIDRYRVSICQMSLELHGMPLVDESDHDNLILALIEDSAFLPVWTEIAQTVSGKHSRWFFINVEDNQCIQIYLRDRFM